MQRFDFVQERLNFLISKWQTNPKLFKARPQAFTQAERDIQRLRKSYSTRAMSLNMELCLRCQGLELPVFAAERQLLSSR